MSVYQPSIIPTHVNKNNALDTVRTVIQAEATTLQNLVNNLPLETLECLTILSNTIGSIIFTGAGKSGHVGQKLSATFSSLGLPSFFLHPYDALHGDMGKIRNNDTVIMLSKSGISAELELMSQIFKQRSITTILVCCSPGNLTQVCSLSIQLPLEKEACLYNLAPTSSSTMMQAFGDALAVALSTQKGFSSQDFARNHPSGALGRSLLLDANALMHTHNELPFLTESDSFETVLNVIIEKKLGVGIVATPEKKLLGIITDGDIRRACAQGPQIFSLNANSFMTKKPKTINATTKASHALNIMEQYNITSLIVIDENNYVLGLLHIHALLKAGIRKDI